MTKIRYENLTLAHTEEVLDFSFDPEDSLTVVCCDKDATRVTVPSEVDGVPVTTVNEHAFEDCTRLCEVTLPARVHTVLTSAFRGCTALTRVVCAADTYFGVCAFSGCTALCEMSPIACASEGLFENCTALGTLPLCEGVRVIESEAFAGCTGLTAVVLPESVRTVEGLAFRGCGALSALHFPDPTAWVMRSAYREGDTPIDCSDAKKNARALRTMDFDDGVLGYYRTVEEEGENE